jgi:hypothetical protein
MYTDAKNYVRALGDRQALETMRLFDWGRDHHPFRETVPTTLAVVDTRTGALRTVLDVPYHVHHVLFVDDATLLVNHPRGHAGMWTVDIGTGATRELRPATAEGAHDAHVVHQVITERGIVYEAVADLEGGARANYLGCYDPATDSFAEGRLPLAGYVHAGHDPAGRLMVVEHAGERHQLFAVEASEQPRGPDRGRSWHCGRCARCAARRASTSATTRTRSSRRTGRGCSSPTGTSTASARCTAWRWTT